VVSENVPEFVPVADVRDLPDGQATIVLVDHVQIALFNAGGRIYATGNMCPHRGGPLGAGSLEGCLVTCPWHAWSFDIRTGQSSTHRAAKIVTYPVRMSGTSIEIGLGRGEADREDPDASA
jgi:nitrite reductase (NADH) small subunit